ncbi:MAG: class I SAM-dependent methyltransferase [Bdellovibrionales bacterium]
MAQENLSIELSCVVCGHAPKTQHVPWVSKCPQCEVFRSTLWNEAVWEEKSSDLDEAQRFQAIGELRKTYARNILNIVNEITPLKGKSLLDVGCGYGWFLEASKGYSLLPTGIEPEAPIAEKARSKGLQVINGLFPDCLNADSTFDVLTFNDVLEHIPAVKEAVEATRKHLSTGGHLVLVLPSSRGFFYRLATVLSRFGLHGPYERLWQKQFHSPHVTYFHDKNLEQLLVQSGFRLVKKTTLPAFEVKGLWNRLAMTKKQSPVVLAAQWLVLALLAPVMRLLPQDIIMHVYRLEK